MTVFDSVNALPQSTARSCTLRRGEERTLAHTFMTEVVAKLLRLAMLAVIIELKTIPGRSQ
jgi:hypothetical protein